MKAILNHGSLACQILQQKMQMSGKLVEWQTSWMKDYGVDYFRVET
ncbi:MAG: hypothetical protein ACLUVO_07690 [Roseburia sp.]